MTGTAAERSASCVWKPCGFPIHSIRLSAETLTHRLVNLAVCSCCCIMSEARRMAKLRKQKQGEHKAQSFPESASHPTLAIVRHQKLCLSVDFSRERIYGHTELKVVAPTTGVIGLHAHGLNIERVLFEGAPVQFEVASLLQDDSTEIAGNVSSDIKLSESALDVANMAYENYLLTLEKETAPELLIYLPELSIPAHGMHDSALPSSDAVVGDKGGSAEQIVAEASQEAAKDDTICLPEEKLKLVQVDYWLEKPVTGAHFLGRVFLTNNQLQRARCWFPCVDFDLQRCSYDMEFTVNSDYVAVSNGKLLYQVLSKEDLHLKTYVYKLDIPVAAQCISLVVAPLEILPDRQVAGISHLCMPGSLAQLQCTVSFFHLVFSYYEDFIGAPFPFGCYNHVFIDSESTVSNISIGASMVILSSHLLVDERVIDQTVSTRIKLAHALAQQWFGVYITPNTSNDAWLLEGLAGFLTDNFIKRHFGNNEACYRRYKANESVCKVDVEGAPPLSPAVGIANLLGTEKISELGKIRSWKAVAVIQMLEKQMGPEPFRKILQRIILRAQDPVRNMRTLSAKEFRHLANKIGNLERPFLKEFFPRWVESTGCPVLRMGFVYSKRRNMVELAVHRGCTAAPDVCPDAKVDVLAEEPKDSDIGWPGMMSIRVHEVDGMYDHPSLPMAGDTYQLLEIQCHSKLAGRRIQRPKKGSKLEAAEEIEPTPPVDTRQGIESPLLWLRADPQIEYLAEIHLHQPEHMWINQLEKDRDVVAQIQAVAALASLPQTSFAVINALNTCLNDSKVFCRVRVEAAIALADTASEATGWVGLSHLIKFYKSRRYDSDIGLPRPNDFHDLAEYFVLQVIPGAVAAIHGSDGKSPLEAVDFIMQLIKHNDNSGNQYTDVYWLASLIQSIGKLEFCEQSIQTLSRVLKRIDRFLQYDRLMPSYNALVTISCIRTLTELALKFSHLLPMDRFEQLLQPFRDSKTTWWKIRVVTLQSLFDLEVHMKGLDAGMQLALKLVDTDPMMRVQSKLFAHILHVCTLKMHSADTVSKLSFIGLLHLLENRKAFNNTFLRHHVFSLLQVLAGRPATLVRTAVAPLLQPLIIAAPIDNATPQDSKGKAGPLKVRIQRPQESQNEPVRIRLVPPTSHNIKEAIPAASCSSSGKPDSDRKVGVLKLRLKPTSSAQEALTDEKVLASAPVRSSSVSMELGMKTEHTIDESPNSNRLAGSAGVIIKEGSDWLEGGVIPKHGSPATDMNFNNIKVSWNPSDNEMKGIEMKGIEEGGLVRPERMRSLEVLANRILSDVGVSSSDRVYTAESHDGPHLRTTLEDIETRSKSRLEDEDSSKFSFDEVERKETESERRQKEEKREKKRKREGERTVNEGDRHEKKRGKHDDPEYLERKRLKKEQKRKEKEQRRLQKCNENGAMEAGNVHTNTTEKRPLAGTSDTVVRIKFKKLL